MPGMSHTKAAEAHEQAAMAHHAAAKSHKSGDHKAGLMAAENASKKTADASGCCGTALSASKKAAH